MAWSDMGNTGDRARMVEHQLRARGIVSEAVLEVMGRVPREQFLPPDLRSQAYRDQALPLSEGQTVSQPYMVAVMTEALGLRAQHRVLEIGTGSGYQTAVLSRLASEVYTVERIQALADGARETLDLLECGNVRFRVGDGSVGWAQEAPFQAILVTAGAPRVPEPLKNQLCEGGRLVVPVGDQFLQELVRVTRSDQGFVSENLLKCRFVPLLGAEGWKGPQTP